MASHHVSVYARDLFNKLMFLDSTNTLNDFEIESH